MALDNYNEVRDGRRLAVRRPTTTRPSPTTYNNPDGGRSLGTYDYSSAPLGYDLAAKAQTNQDNRDWANLLGGMPTPNNGGGGGGGRGRGGGGGGGFDQKAATQNQIGFLQSMLQGGRWNPALRNYRRNTTLDDGLRSAVSADRANAAGAYNQLDEYMRRQQGLPTAYEGIQRQAGPAGDAFNVLLDVLGANQTQAREGRASLSQFGRADADRNIASQQLAGSTAINLREDARREQIDQQNFASTNAAREAQNQIAMQIAQLAASVGGTIPALAELGLT